MKEGVERERTKKNRLTHRKERGRQSSMRYRERLRNRVKQQKSKHPDLEKKRQRYRKR